MCLGVRICVSACVCLVCACVSVSVCVCVRVCAAVEGPCEHVRVPLGTPRMYPCAVAPGPRVCTTLRCHLPWARVPRPLDSPSASAPTTICICVWWSCRAPPSPPPSPRLLWARQGVPGDPSGMRLILAPPGGHSLAFQGRGLAIMAGALSAVCARVPCFCPRSERHGTLAWHCSPHCGHLPTRVRIVIGFIKTYCTAVSGFMGSGCFDSTFNSLFDGDVCVFAGARALSKGQLYLFISVVSCAF